MGKGNLKHGHAKTGKETKTHRTWKAMKRRCININDKKYKDYGGRGITVCERWLKFENFLEDMEECPPGLSLDRIDNSLGYYKENCRWSTQKEQTRNTRKNVNIIFNGKTQCLSAWAEEYKISPGTLWCRIYKSNWTIERALMTPTKYKIKTIL